MSLFSGAGVTTALDFIENRLSLSLSLPFDDTTDKVKYNYTQEELNWLALRILCFLMETEKDIYKLPAHELEHLAKNFLENTDDSVFTSKKFSIKDIEYILQAVDIFHENLFTNNAILCDR